jgi:hypothetical protein
MEKPNKGQQNDSLENASFPKRNVVFACVCYLLLLAVALWLEWKFGVFTKLGTMITAEIKEFFAKPAYSPGYLPTPTR